MKKIKNSFPDLVLSSYGYLLPGTFSVKRASWQKGVTGSPAKMVWENRSEKEQSLGRGEVRAHLKNLGPKHGRLLKKVWVNGANMALWTTVQLSGQSNNIEVNLKESIQQACVKAEKGHIPLRFFYSPTVPSLGVFHADSSVRNSVFCNLVPCPTE